jgi:hypothetical protein
VREGAIDGSSRDKNNKLLSSDCLLLGMCAAVCWYAQEETCLLDARSNPESSIAGISAFSYSKIIILGTDNAHDIHRQLTSSWPPFSFFFPPFGTGSRWAFFNLGFWDGGMFVVS